MNKEEKVKLQQAIKLEYKKCAADPAYFMKKYCKIQHPSKGTIDFELFPFQETAVREFRDNPKNIILKCRQMGISTLTAGYSMWLMTFHKDKSILVIATTQDVAKNLVTKVQVMQENLPSWIQEPSVENNRTSLRLENGSQIKAVSSSGNAGRSHALSLLVIDEAAFIPGVDEIWTSVQSAMTHGGGNAIVLSTPNGMGNFFYRMWRDAEEGKQPFNTIKLHWTLHPEYDQDWRDDQDILLGKNGAAQECDCDFISSGNSVVDLSVLQWYNDNTVKEPISKEGIDGNYWRWSHPDFTKDYVVSADVSRGDGEDYSTFHVIDIESNTQVAEYRGKMETKEFGNILVNVATEWNNALLIVENSNIGWATIQQIIDRQYQNLFYMDQDLKYVDENQKYNNKLYSKSKRATAGFTMSSRTRPLVISKLELYTREKNVTIQSKRMTNELMTFIWHNGKAQAASGYNDDLTMALGIGLWVRDTALILRQRGIDLNKQALGMINKTAYEGSGIISTRNMRGSGHPSSDPYSMDVKGGGKEDLRWLLG